MRAAIILLILNAQICATQSTVPLQQLGASETPTFRTEARQVILAATVWKKGADLCDPYPRNEAEVRACYPLGLTSKNFRVFENGKEQTTNYFAQVDPGFDADWVPKATSRGTWLIFLPPPPWVTDPVVTYLVGYIPPALKPGECRTISAVVEGYGVFLHRDRYCNGEDSGSLDPVTLEGTTLGSQMRDFAKSAKGGSIKVSAQAFVFRSTGVLRFEQDRQARQSSGLPAPDFNFVVEVRDPKAPATVQIATLFGPVPIQPWNGWEDSDCVKHHAALHVLGMIYKMNGEVAAQFGDTFTCSTGYLPDLPHKSVVRTITGVPSRFDSQVDLPAGDYELRVVVSDYKGHYGRAELPIHVPRFDGRRLTISDVSLSRFARNKAAIAKTAAYITPAPLLPTPLVSKNLQYLPDREIAVNKRDPAFLYFEIYEPLLEKKEATVYFRMKITDLKTGAVVLQDPTMNAAEWVLPGNVVVPVGLKFTAGSKLKKGSYRLEVQALDAAGQQSEWQSVDFSVR